MVPHLQPLVHSSEYTGVTKQRGLLVTVRLAGYVTDNARREGGRGKRSEVPMSLITVTVAPD